MTLVPKPEKNTPKRKNYKPMSVTNIHSKILNNILAIQSNNTLKESYTIIKRDLSQECKYISISTNLLM